MSRMPVISALKRQEDCCKFEANVGFRMRRCLKTNKQKIWPVEMPQILVDLKEMSSLEHFPSKSLPAR